MVSEASFLLASVSREVVLLASALLLEKVLQFTFKVFKIFCDNFVLVGFLVYEFSS